LDREKDDDGDPTARAYAGAMLIADGIDRLLTIVEVLSGKKQKR